MFWEHPAKTLKGELLRKFRSETMNIPDDLDMGEMSMDVTGLKKGVMWKLNNETDPVWPEEYVGDCDKVGRKNGVKE